jgi:hypothetical protein
MEKQGFLSLLRADGSCGRLACVVLVCLFVVCRVVCCVLYMIFYFLKNTTLKKNVIFSYFYPPFSFFVSTKYYQLRTFGLTFYVESAGGNK